MSFPHASDAVLTAAAAGCPSFAAVTVGPAPLLAVACWLAEGLDEVDAAYVTRWVDFLAYLTDRAAAGTDDPRERLLAMRRVLVVEEGLSGDRETYDDPQNSFLKRVIERRRGLPISLAVLWLGVAERLGWPLRAVNFPVHFLVRYDSPDGALVVDPFDGGRVVDLDGCLALARPAFIALSPARLKPAVAEHLLAPTDDRRVIGRMLRNLEQSYARRQQWPQLANVLAKQILVDPHQPEPRRDLGRALAAQGDPAGARRCWESYLSLAPEAPDRQEVIEALGRLRFGRREQ